ncbi:hypothetical protein QR680_017515 [Steinernema hermaphroditum]|uniref:RING-type domain-containing protein n=1 Tax=Steinernema hermaphroditum TaxID=289476 RepID=A0AA39LNS7_9BILA|nr:hypothetical protein QR680_017515 [Steinernema hermaphroditum]
MLALLVLLPYAAPQFVVEVLEPTEKGQRPVVICEATGANFGTDVISFGLGSVGCAVPSIPYDACRNNPLVNSTLSCNNYFALVPRGNCSFSEKAYYVQQALPIHFNALIVYNDPGEQPIPMSGSKFSDLVDIPVVMVDYACMINMEQYSAEKGCIVKLKTATGYFDLVKYLVPFVAVVLFCFIVLLISMVIRCCRERRRKARKRLSRSNLKKLPTRKFKKGDYPETCAICLEDFIEGEKLRVLPCKHAYHCKCIDPWLTKTRKVCPVCKRKVGPSNGSDSSDSENERRRVPQSTSSAPPMTHRENAPLLSNEHPIAGTSQDSFSTTPEFPRRAEDGRVVGSMIVSSSENERRGRSFVEDFQRLNARNRSAAENGSTELLIENEFVENDDSQVSDPQPSRLPSVIKNTLAPIFKVFSRGRQTQSDEYISSAGNEQSAVSVDVEIGNNGSDNRGFDPRVEGASGNPQHQVVEAQIELHPQPADQESPRPPRERRRRHPAAQNRNAINPPTNTGLNLLVDGQDDESDEVPEDEEGAQTYAPSTSKNVKQKHKRPRRAMIGGALATSTHSVPANMAVRTFTMKEGYKPPNPVSEITESDPPSPALSPQDLLAGPMDNDSDEQNGAESLDPNNSGYSGVVALNFQRR